MRETQRDAVRINWITKIKSLHESHRKIPLGYRLATSARLLHTWTIYPIPTDFSALDGPCEVCTGKILHAWLAMCVAPNMSDVTGRMIYTVYARACA